MILRCRTRRQGPNRRRRVVGQKAEALYPFSQIAGKLPKLSTAERAQLRNVLLHALRDLFDVGNELSAEFHGVRSAGPTLFWRSFRETGC